MSTGAASTGPPDPRAVATRAQEISQLLAIHAGGIYVDRLDADGSVQVEFTGMCTGCPYRAVTLATTIRPALSEVGGVTSVSAAGVRISEQAQRRLAKVATPWWPSPAVEPDPNAG